LSLFCRFDNWRAAGLRSTALFPAAADVAASDAPEARVADLVPTTGCCTEDVSIFKMGSGALRYEVKGHAW
jgi:hypothetical protein